jgi:rhamnosyl/mannosyltransferase
VWVTWKSYFQTNSYEGSATKRLPGTTARGKIFAMKVLHIGTFYPPHIGGVETHLQHLAEGLKGHIVTNVVVANDYLRTDRSWVNGVRITRVANFGRVASSALTWGMSREIARTDADIVHIQAPNPLAMNAFLRSGHHGKLVITHQADIIGRKFLKTLIWPIWRKCMDKASAIIVSSQTFAESSEELAPYRDKWRIIPMGMDFSFLDNIAEQDIEDVRSRFPGPIVLYVGRLVPYKGLPFLIDAMREVKATLLIIGEGPEETSLKLIAKTLGNRVAFLGRVPSLGAYYRAADLFVLPSCEPKEAFGLVQLEAMYCGVPVINTALRTSVPEISVHGITGITVQPRNVLHLHQAISSLLADPDLRARLSRSARKRAAQFTVEIMVEEILKVYCGVQKDPRSKLRGPAVYDC